MAEAKTGEELITAAEAATVQQVSGQVAAIRAQAATLVVTSDEEAAEAAQFLRALKAMLREAEEARTFIVKPLNEHVAAINARFKPNREALEQVERDVKRTVLGYQQEQERKRQEEQARLDAERRAREEEALAEQRRREEEAEAAARRAAEEAEAAAAAAAAAEAERLAALSRDQESRRARISKLSEDALQRVAAGGAEDAALAREELASREAHREAEQAAQRAREAEEEARRAQVAAYALPPEPEPVQVAAGPARLAGTATRKVWKVEVIDPNALEDWARMPDMPEIRRRVRDGLRESPGLRIYQEDNLAVGA